MLLCPVRDCRLPLARESKRLVCGRGHSFDAARSGYFNLLQPQERRSKQPGDTSEAVQGRRRLHDLGVTMPLLLGIAEMVHTSREDVVLDAGCGDGFYLGTLAREIGFEAHGVDISTAAIDAAARRYSQCEWIVANADRFIPYADKSFSLILSITARMNAGEFRRVLGEDGRMLVAIPAPDDLIELRGAGRDRVERTAETFAELDADAVHDVLHAIYRPLRAESPEAMRVTLSLDLLLFGPKAGYQSQPGGSDTG
jgi:23S rRNA (guanine745-N1)-methyltransferase